MNIKCNSKPVVLLYTAKPESMGENMNSMTVRGVGGNNGFLNSTQMEMHKRNSKTLTFQQKESAKQSKSAKENNAFSLPHPHRKYQTLQERINRISYSRVQEGGTASLGGFGNTPTSPARLSCTSLALFISSLSGLLLHGLATL